jgi:hypothetical protein
MYIHYKIIIYTKQNISTLQTYICVFYIAYSLYAICLLFVDNKMNLFAVDKCYKILKLAKNLKIIIKKIYV